MNLTDLRPGCQIEIRRKHGPQDDEFNSKKDLYYSRLFDFAKSGYPIINLPTKDGRDVILRPNVAYLLDFIIGDKIYEIEAVVEKMAKIERFQVLVMKPMSKLEKIQRRNYFRLDCSIPVVYLYIESEIAQLPTLLEVKESISNNNVMRVRGVGTILDISGGGMRFISTQRIEDREFMLLQFTLSAPEGDRVIEVVARIIRSYYVDSIQKYEHRMQFMFRDNDDRENIIKFIFEEERRLRKKVQG